ncbi:hypothetical protein [Spiroplasma endosymbiont of Aspidapion aeneum]|uniref:hypothetical protein n=1 Tax=Spiroplasma endosymbiont of Aspidapion aeneum TaxID=3066276 RepID=UPI00313EABBD
MNLSKEIADGLFEKITKEEYGVIEHSILMNLLNTTSFILLSSYGEKINEMIGEDKDFDTIFKHIRESIKHPEDFVAKYVDFIKSKEFSEVFYDYIGNNRYSSWAFEINDNISKKLASFKIEYPDFIEYFIDNIIVPNISELVVKYNLIGNIDIVDEFVDAFITGIISMSIDQSIDDDHNS